MVRKKVVCILLICVALVCTASAYIVKCDCPEQVAVGEPIIIDGTSNLPPGFSADIILYRASPSVKEVDRKLMIIQQDGSWSVTFPTGNLEAGQYKLELEKKEYDYGSSSDISDTKPRLFKIIDRTAEIDISSDKVQEYNGILDISGTAKEMGDRGVRITVAGSSGIVYGPEYIPTNADGKFSKRVPIRESGTYSVVFYEFKNGEDHFISEKVFRVVDTSKPETQTPDSSDPAGKGTHTYSASSESTRDNPAYFAVDTREGTLTVTTSYGIDWVVEYIDENHNRMKVNKQGKKSPEEFQISVNGGMIYVKVYPVLTTDSGIVTLTAQNANSVTVSESASALFGDKTPETNGQESPISIFMALIALIIACVVLRRQ